MTGGSPPEKKQTWGRLLILLLPLAVAMAFSAWWVKRTPQATPAAAPASRSPSVFDALLSDARRWAERLWSGEPLKDLRPSTPTRSPDGRRASIKPSFTLDLESGVMKDSPSTDLWWHYETRERRSLDGRHGALLALITGRTYEQVDAPFLAGQRYSIASLRASGADAPVREGAVIGVRTVEGNLVKMRVVSAPAGVADIQLEWQVYAPPAGQPKGDRANWERTLESAAAAYRAKQPEEAALVEARAAAPNSPSTAHTVQSIDRLEKAVEAGRC